MANLIVILILVSIVFMVIRYMVKERRKGNCIGCSCSNGCKECKEKKN